MLISRQRHKSTPDMVYDVFNYVTDKAHAEAFGEPPLWGGGLPKDERFGEYGHVGTRSCQSVLPGTTRHRDRDVVVFAQSEEVKIVDAFPVQPSTKPLPPRSRYAKASRLLRCSSPAPQPTPHATPPCMRALALSYDRTCIPQRVAGLLRALHGACIQRRWGVVRMAGQGFVSGAHLLSH